MACGTAGIAHDMVCSFTRRIRAVMTGVTGARHTAVVERLHRFPGGGAMAIITGIGACYMVGGFTGCRRTVVAAEAVAGHRAVIKAGGNPGHGEMAVIAFVTALDMVRCLAFRLHAVVAGLAGACHRGVIHTGITPAELRMAVIAGLRAFYMIGTFLGRGNRAGLAMTSRTTSGRAFENSMGMAGFAAHTGMGTV